MTVGEEEWQEESEDRDRRYLGPESEPCRRVAEWKGPRHDDQGVDRVLAGKERDAEAQRRAAQHPADQVSWLVADDQRADDRVREDSEAQPDFDEAGATHMRRLERDACRRQRRVDGDARPTEHRRPRAVLGSRKD